jgi:hypothetical protein
MTSPESHLIEAFAKWLLELGSDVAQLSEALDVEASRPPASTSTPLAVGNSRNTALETLAGALNYLFKSVELIQDGIEDLGYLDDCFVIRVCAASAVSGVSVRTGLLERLSAEADVIRDFLGSEDYSRLRRYSEGTQKLEVRGRTPADIILDEDVRGSFVAETLAWAKHYQPPALSRDPSTLVRLRSFLAARLPS